MPGKRMAFGALTLLLVGAAGFAGQPKPKTYLLRYRFLAGQQLRYRTTVNVRAAMPGASTGPDSPTLSGAGESALKVLQVNPDGSAQISGSQRVFYEGPGGKSPGSGTIGYTLTPLGRMKNVRLPGITNAQWMGRLMNPDALAMIPAVLPARPVRPGDRWTSTMPNPLRGGRPMTVSTRFVQVEMVSGMETARLQQYFAVPVSLDVQQGRTLLKVTGKVTITAATNFATQAGRVVRSALVGSGAIRFGSAGKPASQAPPTTVRFRMNGTMNLIK
jgi:hypothetical protein